MNEAAAHFMQKLWLHRPTLHIQDMQGWFDENRILEVVSDQVSQHFVAFDRRGLNQIVEVHPPDGFAHFRYQIFSCSYRRTIRPFV